MLAVHYDWLGFYEAASFLKSAEQWNMAWEMLKKAIKSKEKFRYSYDVQFIQIAINANKTDEAEELLKRYVILQSDSARPYLILGLFYSNINKVDLAIKSYQNAILGSKKIALNEDSLYYYAANYFVKHHFYKDAEKALKILLSFDPYNENAKSELIETRKKRKVEK